MAERSTHNLSMIKALTLAGRAGRFELAHGGTLFLDEISMLSPLAQSKVLRVKQECGYEIEGDMRATRGQCQGNRTMVERAILLVNDGEAIDLWHLFLGSGRVCIRADLALTNDGRVSGAEVGKEQDQSISHLVGLLRQNGEGLETFECTIVEAALEAAQGNVAQVARDLGMTRRQPASRLEKIGR